MKPAICKKCAAVLDHEDESVIVLHLSDGGSCRRYVQSCPNCGTALRVEIDRTRTPAPIGSINESMAF